MEQGRPARDAVVAEAWVGVRAKAEAEWVGHLPQARAEVASVRTAEQRLLMLSGSLVMQKVVLSVVRK